MRASRRRERRKEGTVLKEREGRRKSPHTDGKRFNIHLTHHCTQLWPIAELFLISLALLFRFGKPARVDFPSFSFRERAPFPPPFPFSRPALPLPWLSLSNSFLFAFWRDPGAGWSVTLSGLALLWCQGRKRRKGRLSPWVNYYHYTHPKGSFTRALSNVCAAKKFSKKQTKMRWFGGVFKANSILAILWEKSCELCTLLNMGTWSKRRIGTIYKIEEKSRIF